MIPQSKLGIILVAIIEEIVGPGYWLGDDIGLTRARYFYVHTDIVQFY